MAINDITEPLGPTLITPSSLGDTTYPPPTQDGGDGTISWSYSLCQIHWASYDSSVTKLALGSGNPIIDAKDINSLITVVNILRGYWVLQKAYVNGAWRVDHAIIDPGWISSDIYKEESNGKINLATWSKVRNTLVAFDQDELQQINSSLDSVSNSTTITQSFYNEMAELYNAYANHCRCNSDCSCNAVCTCNSNCGCNY